MRQSSYQIMYHADALLAAPRYRLPGISKLTANREKMPEEYRYYKCSHCPRVYKITDHFPCTLKVNLAIANDKEKVIAGKAGTNLTDISKCRCMFVYIGTDDVIEITEDEFLGEML